MPKSRGAAPLCLEDAHWGVKTGEIWGVWERCAQTEIGTLIFYTVEELAAKFKVSPHTIYDYIRSGRLPAKRFGRQYQISQQAIEKFLTEMTEVGNDTVSG